MITLLPTCATGGVRHVEHPLAAERSSALANDPTSLRCGWQSRFLPDSARQRAVIAAVHQTYLVGGADAAWPQFLSDTGMDGAPDADAEPVDALDPDAPWRETGTCSSGT
jgi:hypothetical protein